MKTALYSIVAVLLCEPSSAFTASSTPLRQSLKLNADTTSSSCTDRMTFLKTSVASLVAITGFTVPAFADNDDLAMPTEEEQKAQDAAMSEKLRKKAELQKQARRPMGYADSMEAERNKQKSLQKTKEERRAALCEELGRGC
eukprot:g1473.t1 g1473   contig10:2162271-2163077(+)